MSIELLITVGVLGAGGFAFLRLIAAARQAELHTVRSRPPEAKPQVPEVGDDVE